MDRLRSDLAERGRDIQKILGKLNNYQNKIDIMREESQRTTETIEELQRLNDKL